ncbi:MAG TPA: 3-dehydroquinate synthase [Phycisphaerae bacterium]|nr:3-dehydroquinate synthase [Phycisphaerae bacterium]
MGREAKAAARGPKAALVTDSSVAALYLEPALESLRAAGLEATSAIIPPGEASKTLAQAGELYDRMLRAGLDRGSVVVALGGGVVTDLAGFVAATYMRGIAWIAVSTTLLGQVDASVGGKTAVDHPECKNLIGAFHQPSAVLCDVATLATLPDEELRNGLAETVKHAVIRDPDLFKDLERRADAILARDPAVLEPIVARNVRIKADVVAADEREADLRRILNYGHTIGHALESLLGLTHGRAVALGMMAEARLAERRGLVGRAVVERQKALLERFGLPVSLPTGADAERCLAIMRHDKKAEAGRLRFVLPEAIGSVRVVEDVTDDEIRAALLSLAG